MYAEPKFMIPPSSDSLPSPFMNSGQGAPKGSNSG